MLRPLFFSILTLSSVPAFAVRTAVFPPELKDRAAVWLDQKRIFDRETPADKTRPIWIHGGDSLSTAWSNGSSLRDKLARAEKQALPVARSMDDMLEHFPDAARTWYAGRSFDYAVFGALERMAGLGKWVIVSSALAGATATPRSSMDLRPGEDALEYMSLGQQPERVRLVTFSLGSNDICDGLNPIADEPKFRDRLRKLVRVYPNAAVVPFKVTRVGSVRKQILDRLTGLPDSIGKRRVLDYCMTMWSGVCPNAAVSSQSDELAAQIGRIYEEELGPQFDQFESVNSMDILDMMSSDCFHPSAQTEQKIYEPLSQMILERLRR